MSILNQPVASVVKGSFDAYALSMAHSQKEELARVTRNLQGVAILAGSVLGIGAVFYHFVENLRWLDAIYFSTITLATVGYGDIVPHTDLGKIFTVGYVLVGIGIIGAFANLLLRRAALKRTP